MTELPQRYEKVILGAKELPIGERRKLLALLAVLYDMFAEPPAPIDETGSVWF